MNQETVTSSAQVQPRIVEGSIPSDYVVIFCFAFFLGVWIGHKLTRSGATSARQVEVLRTTSSPFSR